MLKKIPHVNFSEPSFSRWNLLFITVCNFNKFREKQGKRLIDISNYNQIGRKVRGNWILQKVDSRIYRDWLEFCNDPKNEIVFED